jgi:hypothetical protein
MKSDRNAVLAVTGRLIDAPDAAEKRFPLENRTRVHAALASLFASRPIGLLVCSAACGADLLSLDVARQTAVPSLIVLPYEKDRFRRDSVNSRPGQWAPLFDAVVSDAEARGCLVIITPPPGTSPYDAATREIVQRAKVAAANDGAPLLALAVWDGKPRGEDDHTAIFLRMAADEGAEILPYINTASPPATG